MLVYYHTSMVFADGQPNWRLPALAMIALVFLAPFIYDVLVKTVLTEPKVQFGAGVVLATVVVFLLEYVGGFGYRGYAIHLGTMFGTIMAFNVWFRIWPAQRQIITATKNGQAPDPALVALAGTRSRHNTYMSVPLVFTMISQHAFWAASPIWMAVIVLVGWSLVYHLYSRAAQVKGF